MLEAAPVQGPPSPNHALPQSIHVQDGGKECREAALITSPYTTPSHLLSLATLDQPTQLLAKSLTVLEPTCEDYATAPYADSFNWPAVFTLLQDLCKGEAYTWDTKREFFVVVFRSRLLPDADINLLYELDERSHEEGNLSGGLLKYWFGQTNSSRENLATCKYSTDRLGSCALGCRFIHPMLIETGIWRSRVDAQRGGLGPWHCTARESAREMYERVWFGMLKLEVDDGGRNWAFTEWAE